MNKQRKSAAPLAMCLAISLTAALGACKKEEPAPAPTETASVAQQSAEDWIRANYADMGKLLYAKGEYDLDGDGAPEVLAYVGGPMLCGSGGCNLVVLKREGVDLQKVSELSVVQLPVGVLDSTTNGWRDLAVTVAGGGLPAATMKLSFDGRAYPENPTVAPAVESDTIGTVVIAQEPLKPLD